MICGAGALARVLFTRREFRYQDSRVRPPIAQFRFCRQFAGGAPAPHNPTTFTVIAQPFPAVLASICDDFVRQSTHGA